MAGKVNAPADDRHDRVRGRAPKVTAAKLRADVKAGRKRPSEAAMELMTAQRDAEMQTRRELLGKVREARRKRDGARERAKKTSESYENTVALLASSKPDRLDWYEHAGTVPRPELLQAAGIKTAVELHRIMERYRRRHPPKRGRRR